MPHTGSVVCCGLSTMVFSLFSSGLAPTTGSAAGARVSSGSACGRVPRGRCASATTDRLWVVDHGVLLVLIGLGSHHRVGGGSAGVVWVGLWPGSAGPVCVGDHGHGRRRRQVSGGVGEEVLPAGIGAE